MHGIQIQIGRRRPAALLLAGLLAWLALAPAVQAEGDRLRMQVSARVVKHASLRALAQPATLTVTEADLARGYIELPAGTELAVRSNSQDGYLLLFEQRSPLLRAFVVRGLEREVEVGAGSGMVALEAIGPGMAQRQHRLGYRLLLAEDARAGIHPWPLQVSVLPR